MDVHKLKKYKKYLLANRMLTFALQCDNTDMNKAWKSYLHQRHF